jgi:hypothetical protein
LYGPRRTPGPRARGLADDLVEIVVLAAHEWPWWGFKRVAVALRSLGVAVANAVVNRIYRLRQCVGNEYRPRAPPAKDFPLRLTLPAHWDSFAATDSDHAMQPTARIRAKIR